MVSDYETLLTVLGPLAEALRSALRACLREVLPSDIGARSTGRGLGVSRSLGWRVYAVARAADSFTLLRSLPGKTGWSRVYLALERLGCATATLEDLRSSVEALQSRMAAANVDPACLRSIGTRDLETDASQRSMLRARRSAFNSAKQIYGVHAKARIGSVIVSPSVDAGRDSIDLVSLTLFEGLERSRPGPAYPIYHRVKTFGDDETASIDGRNLSADTFGPLVPSLTSEGAIGRELRISPASKIDGRSSVDFVDRDRGRIDSLRAVFAEHSQRVGSPFASVAQRTAELRLPTMLPVEFVVFDVFIHRSIPTGSDPALTMYNHPANHAQSPRWDTRQRLPLEVDLVERVSSGLPAALAASRRPYKTLLGLAETQVGRSLEEFQLYRAVVPHPPMHSSLLAMWRLAES